MPLLWIFWAAAALVKNCSLACQKISAIPSKEAAFYRGLRIKPAKVMVNQLHGKAFPQ